ncbi:hypothetical protein GCM10018952_51720 [Streptosporangium vulgare]
MNPQCDIGRRVLRGECYQLRGEQRPVVIVERTVENENTPFVKLISHPRVEQWKFRFFTHASIMWGGPDRRRRDPPGADLL